MFARSFEDLVDREALLAQSGLDFMRDILEGRSPAPPIAEVLNYHLDDVEPGRVAFRGTPRFAHCNPMGTVHGGWYGTLLDSAMACAVMTTVPKGAYYTTLEFMWNRFRR